MAGELDRFVAAQQQVYPRALAELRAGAKNSHWMWYVFPQIAGLGHSPLSQRYAITGILEAWSYLAHPLLGPRLAECTDAMLAWAGRRSAHAILGGVDAMKFKSSMTLFEAAGGSDRFRRALDRFFAGERDGESLALLAAIEA
jgi:uncharacterized protein (DUF1810 family)